jgi:hypothetical protein
VDIKASVDINANREKKERKMATNIYAKSKAFQDLIERYRREMGMKNPYNPSAPFGGGYTPTTGTAIKSSSYDPLENVVSTTAVPNDHFPTTDYISSSPVELVEKKELDAALDRISSLESQLENVLKMQAKMVERLCKIEGARD